MSEDVDDFEDSQQGSSELGILGHETGMMGIHCPGEIDALVVATVERPKRGY